jgi:hypothetical protein
MSLPDEQIEAQHRLWRLFVERKIPFKLWPRHMISAKELAFLYAYGPTQHHKQIAQAYLAKEQEP